MLRGGVSIPVYFPKYLARLLFLGLETRVNSHTRLVIASNALLEEIALVGGYV